MALRPGAVRAPRGFAGTVNTRLYASKYGVRLKSGMYGYRGTGHFHWTRRHFHPRWRAWMFFDPCTSGWYYYSPRYAMYLPVRYITVVQPAAPVETPVIEAPEPEPTDPTPEVPEPEGTPGGTPDVPEPGEA